jgi:hypothetical protein
MDAFTVNGAISANTFVVPLGSSAPAWLEGLASTSPDVLTADGQGVNLYKLATYALSGVQALAARIDMTDTRLTSLETRMIALESGAISTASGSPITFSTTSLASALNSFGVTIKNGLAQFGTLIADQFVAATNSAGQSSAGTITILTGNTVAQINNEYVLPTTKIFVTFNSQITGSWWVSDKAVGSFRIVLSAPQTTDVSFDYFFVQTEGQISTATSTTGVAPSVTQSNGSDTVPPVITLLGDNTIHLSVGGTFTDPGVTVTDNVDPSAAFGAGGTDPIVTYINGIQEEVSSATINTSSATTYSITYKATDASGNTASAVRSVIVGSPDSGSQTPAPVSSDVTPPVVTLTGDAAMQINVGETFTDPGATALDDVDGDLTSHINVSGAVDTATAGLYTLTYSATDASGNIGTVSRVVTVVAPAPAPEPAPAPVDTTPSTTPPADTTPTV